MDDRWSRSISLAFKNLGHELIEIFIPRKSWSEIEKQVSSIHPDLCFTKNFHVTDPSDKNVASEVDRFFLKNPFPTAIWYLDNPSYQGHRSLLERWQSPPYPQNSLFFYNDPAFKDFFSSREIPSYHLPIGVCSEIPTYKHSPEHLKTFKTDLRFSGTPLFSCELEEVNEGSIREGHISAFLLHFEKILRAENPSMNGTQIEALIINLEPSLRKFFAAWYLNAESFYRAEDEFFRSTSADFDPKIAKLILSLRPDLGSTYSWMQLTYYLHRLRSRKIEIQGGEDWKHFFPGYSGNCRRLDWYELFASYAASKINFCFTKWQIPTAVHDRVFDVLAAGGFPITDERAQLKNTFEKDEIATYRSIEEAEEKIDFYLTHDSERLRLIEKGRDRVLKDHTYEQRLANLIEVSRKEFSL